MNLVGAFLMLYFTDTLGIASTFVGVLFFVAQMWDAVNDPVMGMIVDNTRTKYGKFRIWLVVGTLLNAVVFVLLFTTLGIESITAKCAYVAVMYILYGMTYTIMDVPYWSWLPNLSSDPREREKISVIPRIFASLGGFLICTFGLYMIDFCNKLAGDETVLQKQENISKRYAEAQCSTPYLDLPFWRRWPDCSFSLLSLSVSAGKRYMPWHPDIDVRASHYPGRCKFSDFQVCL